MNKRELRPRADQKVHPSRNAVAIHEVHHLRIERTSRNVGILEILKSVNHCELAAPAQLIIVPDLGRDLVAVDKVRRIIREVYNLVSAGRCDRRTCRQALNHIRNRQVIDTRRLTQTAELAQAKQSAKSLPQSSADVSNSAQAEIVSSRLSVSSEPERSFGQITESVSKCKHPASPENFFLGVELLDLADAGADP